MLADAEEYRHLQILVVGHSRSLEIAPYGVNLGHKVMKFIETIFQAWTVMENNIGCVKLFELD